MPVSPNLRVTPTALPEGFCPNGWQELLNAIASGLRVRIPVEFSLFNYGPDTPAASAQDRPWLKTNPDYTIIGWFSYVNGSWKAAPGMTIFSETEPDAAYQSWRWIHIDTDGTEIAEYTYTATGPDGAGWYRTEPYVVGEVRIFESGAPSARWAACDGTNGTLNYSSRLVGASGSSGGVDLTPRPSGGTDGSEEITLTQENIPDYDLTITFTRAASETPGTSFYAAAGDLGPISFTLNSGGSGEAVKIQPPSIFVPFYKYIRPNKVLFGS